MSHKIILALAIQEIKSRYNTSLIGWSWMIINPLFYFLLYSFVFNVGFKARAPYDLNFSAWFFTGLTPWIFISEILSSSPNFIRKFSNMIKKTTVDPIIFPLSMVGAIFIINLPILFVSLCIGYYFSGTEINISVFLLSMLMMISFGVSASLLLSALSVHIEDISHGIPMISQALFWLTPISWPSIMLTDKQLAVMKLNPIFECVELMRCALLRMPFNLSIQMFISLLVLVSLNLLSYRFFRGLQKTFVDLL